MDELTPQRDVFTVSRLNTEVRNILEASFPLIWIEGEISNIARPASGHLYFSLKDEGAQVRAAMFRGRNQLLRFAPENGTHVLCRAKLSLYAPRGDYQLLIEHMEEAGEGALQRKFEALKKRLADEGLFDEGRKQPLPSVPKQIGVITSPSGAAIRDILTVLNRRFPMIPVVVYPVPVQGEGAAEKIAAMFKTAEQRKECDVLILARGGGSLEDLWSFNEEVVARAIHDCTVPVVSAVGHEVDVTISDFVADRRAATPSMAAEIVTPDLEEWLAKLYQGHARLNGLMQRTLQHKQQALDWIGKRLKHPGQRLRDTAQRLDELDARLRQAQHSKLKHLQAQLREQHAHLLRQTPLHRLQDYSHRSSYLWQRLGTGMKHVLKDSRKQFTTLAHSLNTVSPLATLARGYSVINIDKDQTLLRSYAQVKKGDQINARLAEGHVQCTVDKSGK